MKHGEPVESAFWLDGTEDEELLKGIKGKIVNKLLEQANKHNLTVGKVHFEELDPLSDRVPAVPDHIQGPNVRLLVGWSLAQYKPMYGPKYDTPHMDDLTKESRQRLREKTKEMYAKKHPNEPPLTDKEADVFAEQLFPRTAAAELKEAIDSEETFH